MIKNQDLQFTFTFNEIIIIKKLLTVFSRIINLIKNNLKIVFRIHSIINIYNLIFFFNEKKINY